MPECSGNKMGKICSQPSRSYLIPYFFEWNPQALICEARCVPSCTYAYGQMKYYRQGGARSCVTQYRRLVRRKGASWSLNWPSGANSLAHLQLKCILYVPL